MRGLATTDADIYYRLLFNEKSLQVSLEPAAGVDFRFDPTFDQRIQGNSVELLGVLPDGFGQCAGKRRQCCQTLLPVERTRYDLQRRDAGADYQSQPPRRALDVEMFRYLWQRFPATQAETKVPSQ
ncbi:hypothetical protein C7I85_24580 [Mesorhizobium soli]|uniref:Uncharacterized protein n=1 Tax=Pseudaminobacter soli (ex Li et al. 2025) TaxID=1295366 RepID=A0A2P7S1V7_9HYPH|nr:hypothetical protein C7I85_24580 [Mesorhizobium soli]